MWHEHRIDSYFGALFITLFGVGATFLILHTIDSLPAYAFTEEAFELPLL